MDIARHLPLSQRDAGDTSNGFDRRELVSILVQQTLEADSAGADAFLADAGLDYPDAFDVADAILAGKKLKPAALVRAVRASLVVTDRLGIDPVVDARTLGATALAASVTAAHDRRAAIAGLTVTASDADWSFGRGPVASAPALEIVRFLAGLSDTPPRP